MVHGRLPYSIPLVFGILCLLSACSGGDGNQAEIDALRLEVAALKQAQAESQQAIAALQRPDRAPAKAPGGKLAVAKGGEPGRTTTHLIPIVYSPRKGNEITAVTVVEFADFQCPYCQAAAGLPDRLLKEFPDDVKFVYKHYPLGRHPDAFVAAKAAWAAQQQGKFWEMHDLIYQGNIAQIPVETLRGYAQQLGLDMARFDADMNSNKAGHLVSMDKLLGRRIKIAGTPAYFVNGKRLTDSSPAGLRAMVAEEIAKTKSAAQP